MPTRLRPESTDRRARRLRRLRILPFIVLVTLPVAIGHAAKLPVRPGPVLDSFGKQGKGGPKVWAYDNFDQQGSAFGNPVVGGSWVTQLAWSRANGSAQGASTTTTPAIATSDIGVLGDAEVLVDMAWVGAPPSRGGVVLRGDGTDQLEVHVQRNTPASSTISIHRRSTSNLGPALASVTVNSGSSGTFRVRLSGNVVSVFLGLGGVAPVLTYGLTPPDIAVLGDVGSQRYGMVMQALTGGSLPRFDNFIVQSATSDGLRPL